MFRVETQRFGTTRQVFLWTDPGTSGFKGAVEEGVSLDYDGERIHSWPDGSKMPAPCLGRSRQNAKQYKVFRDRADLNSSDYEFVSSGAPSVFGDWLDYLRIGRDPPNPDWIEEEDWFNYLDKLDEESRRLRERTPWPEEPNSANRDDVAAWVAKQHFITDTSISEIWYLPQGAPADEIRLLELSERLPGNEPKVEPIDFGLNVSGARFRLFVADVSSDQLEKLKKDPARLPDGWRVDGNLVWRRRPA